VSLTKCQKKALQCLVDHGGDLSAGRFSEAMGYGAGGRGKMKGRTGASVLKRMQKVGLVRVYDDWFRGAYVTMGEITSLGKQLLQEQP